MSHKESMVLVIKEGELPCWHVWVDTHHILRQNQDQQHESHQQIHKWLSDEYPLLLLSLQAEAGAEDHQMTRKKNNKTIGEFCVSL